MNSSQNPKNGNSVGGDNGWQSFNPFGPMNDNPGQYYMPNPNHGFYWQTPQYATQQDISRLQRYTDDNFNIMHRYMDIIAKKIENLDDKLNIIIKQIKTGQNRQNNYKQRNNQVKINKQPDYEKKENVFIQTNNQNNKNANQDQFFFESIFKIPTEPAEPNDKDNANKDPKGSQDQVDKPEMIIHIADIDSNGKIKPTNGINDPLTNILGPLLFNSAFGQKPKGRTKNKPIENNIESDEEFDDPVEYTSEDVFEELNVEANTIDDLIKLGDMYDNINKETKETNKTNEIKDKERKDEDTDTDTDHEVEKSASTLPNLATSSDTTKKIDPENKDTKQSEQQKRSDDDRKSKHRTELINKMLKTKKIIKPPIVPVNRPVSKVKSKKANSSIYETNGKKYSINIEVLHKLKKPLAKLQSLVGLQSVKDAIVDMILYYVQGFENRTNSMLHTVIEGPPGVGKTEIGKILAEIYAGLGVIPSSKFKLIKRTDLVGEYLGHTAKITQQVIDEADGGVLFIDEAYSLGNEEKRDSFAKECIDTINQNLSEKKRNLIVIIAGYPEQLEKCFFSYNPGLKRRFPFKYTIDGYQPTELCNIFLKKIKDSKWKLSEEDIDVESLTKFFTENKDNFPNFGGDIDNLLVNCKFMHSRRLVGKHPKHRFKLAKHDIDSGLNRFIKNKGKPDEHALPYKGMFL